MGGKKRARDVSDAQIVACYQRLKSGNKVAAALGLSVQTTYRALRMNGVGLDGLTRYRRRIMRFVGREAEIRGWYEAGETLDVIRARLGGASDYSIKHAIRRDGGSLRDNPAPTIKQGELERILALHASGMGHMRISIEVGRSQKFVGKVLRSNGVKSHKAAGPDHGMWKGGRYKTGCGYIKVHVVPDDPLWCMSNGSHVLEHRLVMARHLGRPLLSSETRASHQRRPHRQSAGELGAEVRASR